MPGLVGYIARTPGPTGASAVAQMVRTIAVDADTVTGQLDFAEQGASLGWAVRRNSYADCLPIWNEARDVCLLFFGEHFSDGGDFRRAAGPVNGLSPDDARWLVRMYEILGDRFFVELNGIFSGVVIDRRAGTERIVLFNDRYGLSRVYYHENEAGFWFASEAKALLQGDPRLRQLAPQALAEYFRCGFVLGDRSLFRGISLLPVASAWSLSAHGAKRHSYFNFSEWENQAPLSPEEFYSAFKETFTRAARQHLPSRQAVALSVTAGVDSRLVLAALRPEPASLPCYTFGGMYRESADVRFGRLVATAAGQHHQVLAVTPDFFRDFTDLASRCVHRTDGAMDVSGSANLMLNGRARELAPVRLTGNFGGEILRGITGFKPQAFDTSVVDTAVRDAVPDVDAALARARAGHPLTVVAARQIPWFHHAMFAAERSQLDIRTPFLDRQLVALAYRAPTSFRLNKNPAYRYIHETDPRIAGIPTDRGTVWTPATAMESGRSRGQRLREEFLPRAEYAFDYGMPRWLARVDRLISPLHLERLFLGHQKFVHFRLWYRRELAGQVRAILLDPRSLARPHLNGKRVEQVVKEHTHGSANHTLTLHKLLTLELIHRTLLD